MEIDLEMVFYGVSLKLPHKCAIFCKYTFEVDYCENISVFVSSSYR